MTTVESGQTLSRSLSATCHRQPTLVGQVPGGYAWDLARGADGTVYVAAGSPAAVYRLQGDEVELVVELPASNALDLAVRARGWDSRHHSV